MILSFSVFREKIENGTKIQTIRPYNERQYKRFCNAKKYQLYWHNPRNGGTLIREVEPIKHIPIFMFDQVFGTVSFNDDLKNLNYLPTHSQLAINDGFEFFSDLKRWFYEKYGQEMFEKKFMVLRWRAEEKEDREW